MTEALESKPSNIDFEEAIERLRNATAAPCRAARDIQHENGKVEVNIIDIREGGTSIDLAPGIRNGLTKPEANGLRCMPSLLLWNEQGLKFFEEVTYRPQYYLTNAEISILESYARDIADRIKPGSIVLELGSGALRKTEILLQALDDQGKSVDYYALDLDRNELVRTLSQIQPGTFRHVRCHGLLGTYDDGQIWLWRSVDARRPRCILSLGSTMGSLTHSEALEFWRGWSNTLQLSSQDSQVIVGLDGCKDEAQVFRAYNDQECANWRFVMNALDHANRQLGYRAFDCADWTVRGQWNARESRHTQYLVPVRDVSFEDVRLSKDEKIFVVHSHKWSEAERKGLWEESNLREEQTFTIRGQEYYGMPASLQPSDRRSR